VSEGVNWAGEGARQHHANHHGCRQRRQNRQRQGAVGALEIQLFSCTKDIHLPRQQQGPHPAAVHADGFAVVQNPERQHAARRVAHIHRDNHHAIGVRQPHQAAVILPAEVVILVRAVSTGKKIGYVGIG